MSYIIDNATRIHERQVAAVESVQAFLIKAVDAMTGPRGAAPKAPERLTNAVEKVAAPVVKVVGTPEEVRAYAVASSRDWLEVQHKFQSAALDAMFPPAATVEVPRRAAAPKA